MRVRRGFTLIEALSVVSIISVLVSIGAFVYLQALRQSRDSKRKADVATIAQGFETRFLDATCTNQAAVGQYPGTRETRNSSGRWDWKTVESLLLLPDDCKNFSYYLSNIPTDPQSNSYYYNISSATGLSGKHYRITASLERTLSTEENNERCRQGDTWEGIFGGTHYDGCRNGNTVDTPEKLYNYVIGR